MMHLTSRAAALLALALCFTAGQARAGVIFIMEQVGPDVVMTGGGTINLAGLSPAGTLSLVPSIKPNDFFIVGPSGTTSLLTGALTGPTNFGPGTITIAASSGAGDVFGLDFVGQPNTAIAVPVGYQSGGALSSSAIYLGRDFSSLGVTLGTYNWTLANSDTVSLTIGSVTAAPEPSTLSLAGMGAIVLIGYARSRRRARR